MATRIYTPSSGSPDVTPSTWNHANQAGTTYTIKGVLSKTNTALTTRTTTCPSSGVYTQAVFRYIIGPLTGDQISGTVNQCMRAYESNGGVNGTTSIAVKIITPAGADRAVLLAATASDSAASPQEYTTTLGTRRAWDASENRPISLTAQTPTEGDYLVIEIGCRSSNSTAGRNYQQVHGDPTGTSDCPDSDGDTNAYVPWIDFSQTLLFQARSVNVSDSVTCGEQPPEVFVSQVDRNVNVSDTVTKTELSPTLLESEVILVTTQGVTPTEVSPTLLESEVLLVTTQGVTPTEVQPELLVEDKPPLSITLTGEHAYATESSPTGVVGELSLTTSQGVTKTEVSPTLSLGEVVVVIGETITKTEVQPTGLVSEVLLLTTQGVSAQESGTVEREGGGGPDINVEVNSNTDAPTPEHWIEYKERVLRASRGE